MIDVKQMLTPDDVRPDLIRIAQDFALSLEDDPAARKEFLIANRQNFRWIQAPPFYDEPINFWSYGPEIPETDGLLLFHVCSVWYIKSDGWVYCFRGQDIECPKCDIFEEIKVIVENRATEQWGEDANTPQL